MSTSSHYLFMKLIDASGLHFFFGQISKAYNMRQYWSIWWHRVIYRSLNSHAALMSGTLSIRQQTTFSRILNGFLVFGMGAVMHVVVTGKYGNHCAWGRCMRH